MAKMSVTSSILSPICFSTSFLSLSFWAIVIRPCCLSISYSITFTSWSNRCTPFTSTTAPLSKEILTSCLMLPSPRATLLLARKSLPRVSAICITSSGVQVTGSSAISTSGTPNLSSPYSLIVPSSKINLPASSSRHILCTFTLFSLMSIYPPLATRIVR